MAKSETTNSKVGFAASKLLRSKSSTKAEKAVAASALTRASGKEVSAGKVAGTASKILKDPKSSRAAKVVAASALTQRPIKKPKHLTLSEISDAMDRYYTLNQKKK